MNISFLAIWVLLSHAIWPEKFNRLAANSINGSVSGSGKITLAGTARSSDLNVSGSGKIVKIN